MKVKYIILAASLICSTEINAQIMDTSWVGSSRFSIEGHIGGAWGANNFARKYDRTAFSLGGGLSYKLFKKKYIYVQLITNWHVLDKISSNYTSIIDNIGVEVKHSASSSLLDLKAGIKYEAPQIYYVIPFAKFSFGTRNAYLYSNVKSRNDDEVLFSDRSYSNWSYLYSFTAGLQIPLTTSFHVALSGTYSGTGSLEILLPYQDSSPVSSIYPEDHFMLRRSAVDLFQMQIGISIYIN